MWLDDRIDDPEGDCRCHDMLQPGGRRGVAALPAVAVRVGVGGGGKEEVWERPTQSFADVVRGR